MKILKNIILIAIIVFAIACTKEKKENISIEAIQKNNGVPVKIEKLSKTKFVKEMEFIGEVEGYEQASVYSGITEEVEEVRVSVGDKVVKDQILVVFPEDAPTVQYRQIKNQVDNLEKNYFRMKNLYKSGGISQQKFEEIETQYKVYSANLEAVTKMIYVKAPMDGIVTELNAFVNNTMKAKSKILTVSKLNKLRIKIMIPDNSIDFIKNNMNVEATWNNKVINGKIERISMAMDKKTKSFQGDIILDNSKEEIPVGVTVSLKVKVVENKNVIKIPKVVIQNTKDGENYVWINIDEKAVRKIVEIKNENSFYAEISSGLKEGDILIVEGYKIVKENSKLLIK